ncbi:uncharacterized protein MYCGRDRAFT_94440 [Zymoseptoria tritici IPO323]|uniref:Uncharacterized protein n=1 Tax=Zymoseptoria tritici (strain CBS 115943 / IPO323) TaxID=336722 RepID=F9XFP5_ZYMTI|nr:uncharacterized protein MYCGRDRAFT_94440 [Zymoseptoria tritici IPO323]EGP86149.1 hypothetical protein MYCGRDRAFT_94440 [Zymoseptoria tritici IPO323]
MIKRHRAAGLPVLQSLATFRAMGFGVAGLNLPDFPFYRGGPMGPNLPPAQPQSHNNPAPQQSQYNNPQSPSPVAPLYPQAQNYNLPPPAQQQPQPQPQFQNLSQPQQQSPPPAQSNVSIALPPHFFQLNPTRQKEYLSMKAWEANPGDLPGPQSNLQPEQQQ